MREEKVLRWALAERIEHHLVMILIPTFIITGLPLFKEEWFGWMVVTTMTVSLFRDIHRMAAGVYVGLPLPRALPHPGSKED